MNVFARSLTDDLASLVKGIDSYVDKNKSKQAAAFVVLLTTDPDSDEKKLKEFAKKHNIKNVPLTMFDGVAGPADYKIDKNAEVTVMLWSKRDVKANHAFTKDAFNPAAVEKVLADAPKILE